VRVAKNDSSAESVSGGAVGRCASIYACRVLAGIVDTRSCRAFGVGGIGAVGPSALELCALQ